MTSLENDRHLGGYCYGPADLIAIEKSDNVMWLQLQTISGRKAQAVYKGCVYWRLDKEQIGLHIPFVQQLTVEELFQSSHLITLLFLQKNSDDVESLLKEWENEGLKFYIHYGITKGSEYLVVARELEYKEMNYIQ